MIKYNRLCECKTTFRRKEIDEMNKMLNNMEQKWGKYAIRRLPMILIICYAIGYFLQMVNPGITYALALNPYAILHGQVWRLVTWILIPPESSNLFFTLVMFYFYYSIGMTLEQTWGTFYFNYYIFSGILFTILGAFGVYGYSELFEKEVIEVLNAKMAISFGGQECAWIYGGSYYYLYFSSYFTTYYIHMTLLLAYACTSPDMQVLLMFIIPVKMKVLSILYGILIITEVFYMINGGMPVAIALLIVGASVLNFIVFFFSTKNGRVSMRQKRRQRDFERKTTQPKMRIAKHRCAICGRTDEDSPNLEFRFCSKCDGNYEYCQEHLFTHKHFTRE